MSDIRAWLQRAPQPATLRVYDAEGDSRPVRVGTGPQRWRDALSACQGAPRVDALDREGATLRTWTAEDDARPAPAQGAGGAELVLIARLLAEAGDKGASRHARAYELAFDKQAELLNIIVGRLDSMEKLVAKLLVETASPPPPPPPAQDPTDQMAMTLLQGAMMAGAQGPPPAPPNGRKPPHA